MFTRKWSFDIIRNTGELVYHENQWYMVKFKDTPYVRDLIRTKLEEMTHLTGDYNLIVKEWEQEVQNSVKLRPLSLAEYEIKLRPKYL